MTLAHFFLAAFRRGDVYYFLCAFALALLEAHTLTTGVELSHSVVIPENTIALAGDKHRDGDLRVDLSETARETTHIAIAILELSQSEEVFVLRGKEGQCGFAIAHLMAGSSEYGLPLLVTHLDGLLGSIDAIRDILIFYLVMAHVEPIRQVALDFSLRILNPDSVLGHGLNGQTPSTKGSLSSDTDADG